MNITPSPALIEALRSQKMGWKSALGELIDNSLDAKANHIVITLAKRTVTIQDNGKGCDDLLAMLRLGDHRSHGRTGLGVYGVGLKDAATWLWGMITIESIRGGRIHRVALDWSLLSRSDAWMAPDQSDEDALGRDPGTKIVFHRIDQTIPSSTKLDGLLDELAYTFAPAIRGGAQMIVRHTGGERILPRFEFPTRSHVTKGTVIVDGKKVDINIGIVDDGTPNPRAGLSYFFRHRIIIPHSALGCGSYTTNRIMGTVELNADDWRLTKNKDDIRDNKDALAKAVEEFCRPVLVIAHEQAQQFSSDVFRSKLTNVFRSAFSSNGHGPKESRSQGDSEGTVVPQNTGRTRVPVKVQPGQCVPRQFKAASMQIEFQDIPKEEGIGRVDIDGKRVVLSIDHPQVRYFRTKTDENTGILALGQLAISLFLYYINFKEPRLRQQVLRGVIDDDKDRAFSLDMARTLRQAAESAINCVEN